MKMSIDKEVGKNILFDLYFVSILVTAVSNKALLWHGLMIVCTILGILGDKKKVLNKIFLPFLLSICTGILNFLFVGNMTLSKLMLLVLSWLMVIFVENTKINTKMLNVTSLLINAFLLFKIYESGFNSVTFFYGMSYNYISVYSLLPIIMYYFFVEKYNEKISLYPAVIGVIVCVLGYGRGGILTSFLILFGVETRIILFDGRKVTLRKIIMMEIVLFSALLFALFYDKFANVIFFEKLLKYGLDSRGRSELWGGYIREALKNWESFIFGTNATSVPELSDFNGNVHNSILNVHLYNGIIVFVWYVVSIIATLRRALLDHKMIYFTIFCALLFRSFTDNFVWCSFGMVLMLVLFFESKENGASPTLNRRKNVY